MQLLVSRDTGLPGSLITRLVQATTRFDSATAIDNSSIQRGEKDFSQILIFNKICSFNLATIRRLYLVQQNGC